MRNHVTTTKCSIRSHLFNFNENNNNDNNKVTQF